MTTIEVQTCFLERGWWIVHCDGYLDLYIGEDELLQDEMFTGIGLSCGKILKNQPLAKGIPHFYIHVQREEDPNPTKYKLKKTNIMAPIPDQVSELAVEGVKSMRSWWTGLMKKDKGLAQMRLKVVKQGMILMQDRPADAAQIVGWIKNERA